MPYGAQTNHPFARDSLKLRGQRYTRSDVVRTKSAVQAPLRAGDIPGDKGMGEWHPPLRGKTATPRSDRSGWRQFPLRINSVQLLSDSATSGRARAPKE